MSAFLTNWHHVEVEGRICPEIEKFVSAGHAINFGACPVPWDEHPRALQVVTIYAEGDVPRTGRDLGGP